MSSCSHPNRLECTSYDNNDSLFSLCIDCLKKEDSMSNVMVSVPEIMMIIKHLVEENKRLHQLITREMSCCLD
jgi:hypothetical protein